MGAMGEFLSAAAGSVPPRVKLTLNWGGKCPAVPDVVFDDAVSAETLAAALALADAAERAPALSLKVDPWQEKNPLDICLDHWIDWMHQGDRDLGAKSQALIKSGDAETYDDSAAASDAAAARASRDIAMGTDAMIDSLLRHHKAAIYRRCRIASVWSFPNLDFVATLPEAEKELSAKLSKNVATRAFW